MMGIEKLRHGGGILNFEYHNTYLKYFDNAKK